MKHLLQSGAFLTSYARAFAPVLKMGKHSQTFVTFKAHTDIQCNHHITWFANIMSLFCHFFCHFIHNRASSCGVNFTYPTLIPSPQRWFQWFEEGNKGIITIDDVCATLDIPIPLVYRWVSPPPITPGGCLSAEVLSIDSSSPPSSQLRHTYFEVLLLHSLLPTLN